MQKRTVLFRSVALGALLSVFTMGAALADGFVAATSLSIHVSPGMTVPEGTMVTISGRLGSDRAFCRNGSIVTLRSYGESLGEPYPGGIVERDTTTTGGRYSFRVRIDEQIRLRVWFRGKVGGVHPNIKTCEKSRSATVTIDVT